MKIRRYQVRNTLSIKSLVAMLLLTTGLLSPDLAAATHRDFVIDNRGFVEERGQTDFFDGLRFSWRGNGVFAYFLPDKVIFLTHEVRHVENAESKEARLKGNINKADKLSQQHTMRRFDMLFEAAATAKITGSDPMKHTNDFYLGSCPQGILGVKSYKSITYHDIYPHIDLVFSLDGPVLKYAFVVHPGGDVAAISVDWAGVDNLRVEAGDVHFDMGAFSFSDKAPVAECDGKPIDIQYVTKGNTVTFATENYNRQATLVIDPGITWSSALEYDGYGVFGDLERTADGTKFYYVDLEWNPLHEDVANYLNAAGSSYAYSTSTAAENDDIFISKFSVDGQLLWACRYGGDGKEDADGAITLDGHDNLYVSGTTKHTSDQVPNFPLKYLDGAYNRDFTGVTGETGFILRFNADNTLHWATTWGAKNYVEFYGANYNSKDDIYFTGWTYNWDYANHLNMPYGTGYIAHAAQNIASALILKFNKDCALTWATFLPKRMANTSGYPCSCAIEIDRRNDDVYVAGDDLWAPSQGLVSDLIARPFPSTQTASLDEVVFYLKFNAQNQAIPNFGGYIGKNKFNKICVASGGGDIEFDTISNCLYIAGSTRCPEFYTTNGGNGCAYYDADINTPASSDGSHSNDGFILKVDQSGEIVWSTYLGGSAGYVIKAIKKDSEGNLWFTGHIGGAQHPDAIPREGYYNNDYDANNQNINCVFGQFTPFDELYWFAYYYYYSLYGGFDIYEPNDSIVRLYWAGDSQIYVPNVGGNYQYTPSLASCSRATVIENRVSIVRPDEIEPATDHNCAVNALTVTAQLPAGADWVWYLGGCGVGTPIGTGPTLTIEPPTAPTTYYVRAEGDCVRSRCAHITVEPPIEIELSTNTGNNLLTCTNPSLTITAEGGESYEWSTGANTATITVTTSGTYFVTARDANGCEVTQSMAITADLVPPTASITNLSGTNTLTCATTSINLQASGGDSYLWSTGATSAEITVTEPGNYTVTITGLNGCTAETSVEIGQNITPPTPSITNLSGTNTLTCTTTSINLQASGGDSYEWSTDANSDEITVTAPGSYIVTVTGSNGCTAETSVDIGQNITPPTPSITNLSGTNTLTCTTTSINLEASGGDSYEWSTDATSAVISVSDSTTYFVTVTGSNGCTAETSVDIGRNITPPTASITNLSGTNTLTCATTSINLEASGGGLYEWSTGATSDEITITAPGSYIVTVTGSNGCTAEASVEIGQNITSPTASITKSPDIDELTCDITSLTLTADGGAFYEWSTGANSAAITVTEPGSYTVTVTGSNGCTAETSVVIGQNITLPTASITNLSGTNTLTCTTTSINLQASGGDSYEWSTGATSAVISVSDSTTYFVTVTGSNGCTAATSLHIVQDAIFPPANIINQTGTDMLTCTTTSINLEAAGGESYTWSTGATSAVISVSDSTTYFVTVTGSNGCTAEASVEIGQNITPPTASITKSPDIDELTCDISSLTLTASGGASYEWSTGANSDEITVTEPGSYIVTVTGSNGCTAETSVDIGQNTLLSATATKVSDISCNGANDGQIRLTLGGTPEYHVSWAGGATTISSSPHVLTGLPAGDYTFTITDAGDCHAETPTLVITEPEPLTVSVVSDPIDCFGNTTSATATPHGGTPDYDFVWSNSQTTDVVTNLAAGHYTVDIKDAHHCTAHGEITISQPNELQVAITPVVGNLCPGGVQTFTANITSPTTGDYTFNWGGLAGMSSATTTQSSTRNSVTASLPSTCGHEYDITLTVTDGHNCMATAIPININVGDDEPPQIVGSPATLSVTGCSANIPAATNATELLSYLTSISDNCTPISALTVSHHDDVSSPGDCSVITRTYTVADSCGNAATMVQTINVAPADFTIPSDVTNSSTVHCVDSVVVPTPPTVTSACGTILMPTDPEIGGTCVDCEGTRTFTWTYADCANHRHSWTYTYIVDMPELVLPPDGGSTVVSAAKATPPAAPTVTDYCGKNLLPTDTTMSGTYVTCSGTIVYVYTYVDCAGSTSQWKYTYTVEPVPMTYSILCHDISCNGSADGMLSVSNLSGGDAPYTYHWSNGRNTPSITGLSGGTYSLTIVDNDGCEAVQSHTVIEPEAVVVTLNTTAAMCGSGLGGSISASVNGGTAPYSYHWSNGDTLTTVTNLVPNSYTVSVTDAGNCEAQAQAVVTALGEIPVTITVGTPISCYGYSDGSLAAATTSVNAPLTYVWSNGVTGNMTVGLPAGNYTVTVTDAWGCKGSDIFNLGEPQPIVVDASVGQPSCHGSSDGRITIAVSGGSGTCTYAWNNAVTTQTNANLAAGDYVVTVTDATNCSLSATYTLHDPAPISVNGEITNVRCFGNSDGSIKVTATGGTPPYSYDWSYSNRATNERNINELRAGDYHLHVADKNKCAFDTVVTISSPADLAATYQVSPPSCIGNHDGSIIFAATGGTEPYAFMWPTGFVPNDTLAGLYEGTYHVTLVDAHDCKLDVGAIVLNDVQVDCLHIPNAFTPNGDGINDTWIIDNIGMFPGARLSVFNRWGQKLWDARADDEPWNGQYKNHFVPAGSYLYVISLFNNTDDYVGVVTVVF